MHEWCIEEKGKVTFYILDHKLKILQYSVIWKIVSIQGKQKEFMIIWCKF